MSAAISTGEAESPIEAVSRGPPGHLAEQDKDDDAAGDQRRHGGGANPERRRGERRGEKPNRQIEAEAHQKRGEHKKRQPSDQGGIGAKLSAAPKRAGEQSGVDPAGERGGDRDADMGEE